MAIRVVLVDDVDEYRRLVGVALRLHGGFDVVGEAANGRSAIDTVGAERPDVVVLDLGLPDLPGTEVIHRIREAAPGTGVVVFTGTHMRLAERLGEGVEGYVRKDSDLNLLVATLAGVAARQRGATPTLQLARDPRSPALARRFVTEQCIQWDHPEVIDSAHLVVTELVTNAVTHADSDCELRLSLVQPLLRVEVIDSGPGNPNMGKASDKDEHGRGLLLISSLSAAWGVDSTSVEGQKRVWADLPLSLAAAA